MTDTQFALLRRWLVAGLVLAAVVTAAAVIGWVQMYLAVNDICEALNELAGEPACRHLDGWGE